MGMPVISSPETTPNEPPESAGNAPVPDQPTPEQKRIAELEQQNRTLAEEHSKARGYAIALTQRLAALDQQPYRREPEIPEDQRRAAIRQNLEEDPEATLDAHFQQRVAPMMQNQHQMLANLGKQHFIQKIGADTWNKYGSEIEQFVGNLPNAVETMAQPGAWDNAFRFVQAAHLDDIVEERMRARAEEQQRKTLLEGGGASGGSASAGNRGLTELERMMMKEFGMNEKEWRAYGSRNLTAPPQIEE